MDPVARENHQMYKFAIFKTCTGNLGMAIAILQDSNTQRAQKLCIIRMKLRYLAVNSGGMMDHGHTNAFESLLFCLNDPFKTDTLLRVKPVPELTSLKFLLKLNLKMTLMGVYIISLVCVPLGKPCCVPDCVQGVISFNLPMPL